MMCYYLLVESIWGRHQVCFLILEHLMEVVMDKSKLNDLGQKGKDLFEKGKEKIQTGVNKIKEGQTNKDFGSGTAGGGVADKK